MRRGSGIRRRLAEAERQAGLPTTAPSAPAVTEADLTLLPDAVQRYLRFMEVVGRPRHWSFRACLEGRFKLRPGQGFMPFVAWQYNCADPIARLFHMRLDFAGVLPMLGRDTYAAGEGRMLGKLLGLVTVADGKGPETTTSELVTWLNDAVLLAPSMLLREGMSWAGADERSFDVSVTDAGRTVSARVTVDERGAPVDFSTTDRFADLPGGPVQARWTTPVGGWTVKNGRPRPVGTSAVWHLPEDRGGTYTYAEAEFTTVEYDPRPGRP